MNHLRSLPVCLALMATLVGANGGEAAVRKCGTTYNGHPVDFSFALVVLDGKVIGPLYPRDRESQPGAVKLDDVVPEQEDLLRIAIICLEVPEGDGIVGRQVISLISKSGAVDFMRSHLQAMVEAQEEYRTSYGRYARDVWELRFFASRAPLPIELTAADDAWSARVTLDGVGSVCTVEGGSPVDHPPGQPLGVVRCEAI